MPSITGIDCVVSCANAGVVSVVKRIAPMFNVATAYGTNFIWNFEPFTGVMVSYTSLIYVKRALFAATFILRG